MVTSPPGFRHARQKPRRVADSFQFVLVRGIRGGFIADEFHGPAKPQPSRISPQRRGERGGRPWERTLLTRASEFRLLFERRHHKNTCNFDITAFFVHFSGVSPREEGKIRRFNAENDLPTANAIAKQITNGEFDLLLTASTLSLQTVANANQAAKQSMSSALLPTRSALAWESAAKTRWITLNLWWASEALSLLTRRSLWPGGSSPACNP